MPSPLRTIPDGAAVMADANIFVYALTPQAHLHVPCRGLIERGAQGTIRLCTTVGIAADVLHRAMVLEVLSHGHVHRSADVVMLLKRQPQLVTQLTRYYNPREFWPRLSMRQPQLVTQLTRYRTILRDLRQARVDILALTYRDLHASRQYREQYGLLVNDSLVIAVMRRERIQVLATNDPDFERVPGIAVWAPDG